VPVPTVCQPIQDEIEELRETIRQLQQDLQNARGSSAKRRVVEEINDRSQTVEERQRDLQVCIDSTKPPPPPPVLASFTGRASLRVEHPLTPEPFEADIVVPLEFGGDDERYRVVRALSLPVLGSRTFQTPAGDSTTTIRLRLADARPAAPPYPATPAGFLGYFLPQGLAAGPLPWNPQWSGGPLPAGWMEINGPSGSIDHGLSLGEWFEVDSTFRVHANTFTVYGGVPMNASGDLVLVERGPYTRFGDGVLAGRSYTLRIAGTVSPRP
jgi:hypothetical protein